MSRRASGPEPEHTLLDCEWVFSIKLLLVKRAAVFVDELRAFGVQLYGTSMNERTNSEGRSTHRQGSWASYTAESSGLSAHGGFAAY